MNLIFCIHENYFYHFLASFQSNDPSSIYNSQYLNAIKEEREFSNDLKRFMSLYISVMSHFPFYNIDWDLNHMEVNISNYFSLFPQFPNMDSEWKVVWPEVKRYFVEQSNRFSELWGKMNHEKIGRNYNKVYSPYVKSASVFYEKLTGIKHSQKIDIHFILSIPMQRGKNINYNNKKGIAVSFPPSQYKINQSVLNLPYLYTICHELAHHYSDELLVNLGYKLPIGNSGNEYIQREESADMLTSLFFNSILLPVADSPQLINVPIEFKDKVINSNKLYMKGIKQLSLNNQLPLLQTTPNSSGWHICPDMFNIGSTKDKFFFFSASFGRIFSVPIGFIKRIFPEIQINTVFIEHFKKSGFLVPNNLYPQIQTTDNNVQKLYTSKKFRFHMTQDCNLKCEYCYLDGGKHRDSLSPELAKNAFDLILPEKCSDEVEIEFHGGGEPTLVFDEIKQIYEIALEKISKPVFRIQSNGLFSKKIADWLIEKKIQISISMDGPEFIQTKQRPVYDSKQDGQGSLSSINSFKIIENNIKYFIDQKVTINIISVITAYSLPYLSDIYEYFKHLGAKSMQFNPLHQIGRATKNNEPYTNEVDVNAFIDHFLVLKKQAMKDGIILVSDFLPVFYNYNPRDFQCNACRPGCNIHHNGDVVACTRTYDLLAPDENPFIWANIQEGKMEIDEKKKVYLENRLLKNMPECQECFLKNECAGDCLSELYIASGNMYKIEKDRCNAKREYAKKYLMFLLERDI